MVRQETIALNGVSHRYTLRRSKRARHILLHVHDGGRIEVVVPWRVSYAQARQFVAEQRDWVMKNIAKHLKMGRQHPSRALVNGDKLQCFGQSYRLRAVCDPWRTRSSYGEDGGEVSIFVAQQKDIKRVLMRWYRAEAKKYFVERVAVMQEKIGVPARSIVVSNARSQWGSCIKRTGRISLSWRLAMAPVEVADYVIAHEVAHLKHDNHASSFWQAVAHLYPDYAKWRGWLKRHGSGLVL